VTEIKLYVKCTMMWPTAVKFKTLINIVNKSSDVNSLTILYNFIHNSCKGKGKGKDSV